MEFTNAYLKDLFERVSKRNAGEKEFLQAVEVVLLSLQPDADKRQD